MNKKMRRAVIAGNWKMNKTRPEAEKLIHELIPLVQGADADGVDVVIGVPFTNLDTAVKLTNSTNLKVAAQNVHFEKSGAFTGEISADMLAEIGVEYVIIGHSERRQYFGETDSTVNKRTKAAIEAGLIPIVCIGEYLEERESGITDEVIIRQIKLDLAGLSLSDMEKLIIAYEPVWAIGTGKTATPEQAQQVHSVIRNAVSNLFGKKIAENTVIQYGGSMNALNAGDLLTQSDVDGGLIGGASLKAEDFAVIVNEARK